MCTVHHGGVTLLEDVARWKPTIPTTKGSRPRGCEGMGGSKLPLSPYPREMMIRRRVKMRKMGR
jgi:hypothetical protein